MHRRQVCIWFDNLRRYRSGVDPHSPDLTLNCTVVAVLHTTALPAYRGLPELAEIEARVPKVADDIFRSHRALFDRIDVANQGIQRVWVRAPLDIARKNVRSLNCTPGGFGYPKKNTPFHILFPSLQHGLPWAIAPGGGGQLVTPK